MPTGYTAKLHAGEQKFPDFALQCARAFGALIEMRDEPTNAKIPETFEPSEHHVKGLEKAKKERAGLEKLTIEQAEKKAEAHYKRELKHHKESELKRQAMKLRYEGMLKQVDRWRPPTTEHREFKEFMRSQLSESINFDCSPTPAPTKMDGATWLKKQIEHAAWEVEYHSDEGMKEVERAKERTQWVRALRKSLENY
jgi:hypothetical protein